MQEGLSNHIDEIIVIKGRWELEARITTTTKKDATEGNDLKL